MTPPPPSPGLGSDELHEPEEEAALRSRLVAALVDFFHTDVLYSHKRLVPADLNGMYCRQPTEPTDARLPPFLRYDWSVGEGAGEEGGEPAAWTVTGAVAGSGDIEQPGLSYCIASFLCEAVGSADAMSAEAELLVSNMRQRDQSTADATFDAFCRGRGSSVSMRYLSVRDIHRIG